MLTRNDMLRLSQSLPTANQLAFDKILPCVNAEISSAAKMGVTNCTVDIPPILDNSPAFEYSVICDRVLQTLESGGFTVDKQDLGLLNVSWSAMGQAKRQEQEEEVKIVYTVPSKRKAKRTK